MGANYLETFPDTVCGLAELRRLYLGSNRLRYVPDCVAALRNLEVLYLGGNRLQQVTKYIDRLSKLSLLYLGDNRLVELPSLQGMKNLRTLNIHNNRLTLLPPSVRPNNSQCTQLLCFCPRNICACSSCLCGCLYHVVCVMLASCFLWPIPSWP